MKAISLVASAFALSSSEHLLNLDLVHSNEYLDPLSRPSKCYGITLADASDLGPYQAGSLIGLLKHGTQYEVVTGVTMGAINGYILALHDDKSVDEAVNELCKSFEIA